MTDKEVEAQAISKETRAELVKRVLIVATAVMVTAVLVLLVVLISQIRATQQTGSPVLRAILAQQGDIEQAAKASTSTNVALLDCLDPEGECAKQSREQTAAAVADIVRDGGRITVLAVVCASDVDPALPFKKRLAQTSQCVADGLAARRIANDEP